MADAAVDAGMTVSDGVWSAWEIALLVVGIVGGLFIVVVAIGAMREGIKLRERAERRNQQDSGPPQSLV